MNIGKLFHILTLEILRDRLVLINDVCCTKNLFKEHFGLDTYGLKTMI